MLDNIDCTRLADIAHELSLVEACDVVRNGALRLSTPFTYPNGEHIDVFLDRSRTLIDGYYLSDFGHTSHLLRDSQVSVNSTSRKKQVLRDITTQLGVVFRSGALEIGLEARTPTDISDAIFRLSQACVRISDFATHQRLRSINPFRDDIEDFFESRSFSYLPDLRVSGPYGREIRIDFEVRSAKRTSFVQVLAAMNESSAHNATNEILRRWVEIRKLSEFSDRRFVTVYNSASLNVREDDISLLRDYSDVASYPQEEDWLSTLLIGEEPALVTTT